MVLPIELERALSPEAINELPIRRYEGDVRLVETADDLERAAADSAAESVVGFDTETRPAFRAGQRYLPALAQVATARAVYLLPLSRLDCAPVLTPLLASAATVKAGVGLADDVRALQQVFPVTPAAMGCDSALQDPAWAAFLQKGPPNLQEMTSTILIPTPISPLQ